MENKENRQLPSGFDWRAFTPDDSPMTPMELMADERHKDLSTPEVVQGEAAYDFTSPVYDFSDGVRKPTGRQFNLFESAVEKPVALVFGSYT